MKLLEYWTHNGSHKLVVRTWYGRKKEFYRDGDGVYNNRWRTASGRKVIPFTDNALDGLLWVAQRKEMLQLHRIAFDQLSKSVESK